MKKNKVNITPIGERVLVRPFVEEENKDSLIFIPDTVSKDRPEQGKVIAVGSLIGDIDVGDTVIFSKYGFDEIKSGGEILYIIKEENILAKTK